MNRTLVGFLAVASPTTQPTQISYLLKWVSL